MNKLFIFVFVTMCGVVAEIVSGQKGGICPRSVRGELCRCAPNGPDNCQDDCQTDNDCPGVLKCCYDNCNRICKPPESLRDTCPPGQQYQTCGPVNPATCPQAQQQPYYPSYQPEPQPYQPQPQPYQPQPQPYQPQPQPYQPQPQPYQPQPQPYQPEPQPYQPQPQQECVSGCFCPPGQAQTSDGRCIQSNLCPPQTSNRQPICHGRHEVYHQVCPGCERSCYNPRGEGCRPNICTPGCYCTPGYVRNGMGRCIPQTGCPRPQPPQPQPPQPWPQPQPPQPWPQPQPQPPQPWSQPRPQPWPQPRPQPPAPQPPSRPTRPACPSNQEYNPCKLNCEPTCVNPSPSRCASRCQRGCFCRSPLVRDYTGNCVGVENCQVNYDSDNYNENYYK